MRNRGQRFSFVVVAALAIGCSSDKGGADHGGEDPGSDEGKGGVAVTFPQAVDDALWANPEVYPTIPVRVTVAENVDRVMVRRGDVTTEAVMESEGRWRADVSIGTLDAITLELEAFAMRGDEVVGTATARLTLGKLGVQLTRHNVAKLAGTPRIHRVGDEARITWCDRSEGLATAWMQQIDGAGKLMGHRVALVQSTQEVLYARPAIGATTIGVLYQEPGGPYSNYFVMTDHGGNPVSEPIALDGEWLGSYGGDIAYDGTGYVMVWRSNQGAGKSRVMWGHVAEATGALTGPVELAAAGDGNPDGDIQPISFVSIDAVGEYSLVAFVRERYDAVLDMGIPKSQLVSVRRDGTVMDHEFAGPESDWTFHHEARVFRKGDGLLALWTLADLLEEDPNPPRLVYGTMTDGAARLDPGRGAGALMLSPPDAVDEPFFLDHPVHFGVLAWTDGRGYRPDPTKGKTELYVAPVDAELHAGEAVRFPHSKFYPGTGEVSAANAGTNALLLWVDERHGNGILDPKPEVWFDTAWY